MSHFFSWRQLRQLYLVLAIAVLLPCVAMAALPVSASLSGAYFLTDVEGVEAGLVLNTNGTFEFGISYNGVQQSAYGKWTLDQQQITLTTDRSALAGFSPVTATNLSAGTANSSAPNAADPTQKIPPAFQSLDLRTVVQPNGSTVLVVVGSYWAGHRYVRR